MKCSNVIVPGFNETSKIKDRGLEIKLEMEMDDHSSAPTFKKMPGYKPKNTVKSYKLFKYKDGKIYPLYVDKTTAVPVGVWLQATEGKQGKKNKKKVQ